MSGDEVRIDEAQAGKGITAWEAADTALGQNVQARLSTIRGLEGAAPWGADGAGAHQELRRHEPLGHPGGPDRARREHRDPLQRLVLGIRLGLLALAHPGHVGASGPEPHRDSRRTGLTG